MYVSTGVSDAGPVTRHVIRGEDISSSVLGVEITSPLGVDDL